MITDADALDLWLRDQVGGGAPGGVRLHETPAAKVYVGPERVLKVKQPVDFGYLDFTTLAKREWAIRRELAFNRETAPDLYVAVHAIVRTPFGAFALRSADNADDGRDVVEWALEMRAFRGPVLADQPQRIDGALAERLGREAGRLHGRAPICNARKGSASLDYVLASNAQQLRSLGERLDQGDVERLIARSRQAFDALAPLLDRRGQAGLVRRCHGDLHLGNIVVEQDRPLLFDCIEFNDTLSEIDVAYDIAFLLMDLGFRGRADAANRVLNAWADEAARSVGDGVWAGLALLPLCQSMRAAVRAHVSGHGGDADTAKAYVRAALAHLAPAPPKLFAVGGFSGAGKSTLARALAPALGAAPGALVLRSDEIRKRLCGAAPEDRLPPRAYGGTVGRRVFAALTEDARRAAAAGHAVIADATFLDPAHRAALAAAALAAGVRFVGLWLHAPLPMLESRVAARQRDASDATVTVLHATHAAHPHPPGDWTPIDATDGAAALAEAQAAVMAGR